ncbi:MAG: sulfatase-like hydrolase/transferase [Pirellulaceae bacterium]|nr:sulfatase-like hydrolase/transferase [Pirellulaceae bacterium]
MNRRLWANWFLLSVFALMIPQPLIAQTEKTNFIVVLIDDMGWSDLSCFGNAAVKTENIDRLAKEGIRFTNFYVNAPICSASRTAITTGQYPQRWRISSYLSNRKDNVRRGMANWLEPNAPTLARMLKGAGYATGHFGKWHMGGQRDIGEAPLIAEYGFDASLTNFEGLGPRLLPLCDAHDGNPPKQHALGSDNLGNGPITWMDREKITEGFVDRAIEFIDDAQRAGKPFYVNLWPDDVHSPFFPPEALRDDKSKQALYHGVLKNMDAQLGKLFEFVRASDELRENTLILLCSDNGPEPGAGSALPLRGHKTNLYEGGIRSPLIVWGPAFIEENKRGATNEDNYFCALDIPHSLANIAGVKLSKDFGLDGEDVSATLLGLQRRSRTMPIYWRRPPDRPGTKQEDYPDLAMREGRWKLLCEYDGSDPQLYDLVSDQSETTNLAEAQKEIVMKMLEKLAEWNQSMPVDRGAELESELAEN